MKRLIVRGGQAAPTPRSGRIERRAARAEGGERPPRNVQEAVGGGAREASHVELRRLEAPAGHKPHIDQHQRRAIRSRNLENQS